MPAGCQYLVSPLLDPNLAGTGVSGKVSSSAPASGSAVVAETVPLEAPAPGTHITDTELSYNASVPAPMLMRAQRIAQQLRKLYRNLPRNLKRNLQRKLLR